jgi:hypothetical protein
LHPCVAFFGAKCNVAFGQSFIVTGAQIGRTGNASNSQAVNAKET